jgi:transcriptional regulator with XRE-family HTH domain
MAAWALLRDARARASLSQRELARRAGTAQSEIARIETGRQDPGYATLERLIRAAGFDLKVELAPHDDHDEQLIDAMLALPIDDRLSDLEEQSRFFATAKELSCRSRPQESRRRSPTCGTP